MNDKAACERLILLVGGNPMPNYLATLGLRPKEVCLVSSKQTKSVQEKLKSVIQADFPGLGVTSIVLEDANDGGEIARKIGEVVAKKPEGTHLNYTGGTKLMAAYAIQAFYAKGGLREGSSYLDSGQVLRFDGGELIRLQEEGFRIPFGSLLRLHGVQATPRKAAEGSPTLEDAEKIARSVLDGSGQQTGGTSLLKNLRDTTEMWQEWNASARRREVRAVREVPPFEPETVGLQLSEATVPLPSWPQEKFKSWSDFLGGLWLEDWVEKRLKVLESEAPFGLEMKKGLLCRREGSERKFEVDFVILRGMRLYAISCTTSRDVGLCKLKAFEVIERARQMGGDLVRAAVICPLWGGYLDALKADIKEEWRSSNPTRIFGWDDLGKWSGFEEEENLTSLRVWLES